MRCEVAERELSAHLDGAGDHEVTEALDSHLATCHRCRTFRETTARIREATRVRAADPVPDLVPAIMAEVRRGGAGRAGWVRPEWGRAAVAFAAGLVTAAVIAGGLPGVRRIPTSALATEIPRGIAEASTAVTSYRASFHVVEMGFHPDVPRRTFTADVAFRAPERFRARITDRTIYPTDAWPANDVFLAVAGDRWFLDMPRGCPREALPACASAGRHVVRAMGRPPFDGQAVLPTDIVLPVRSLAGSERVRVRGETEILGRPAVVVELTYRDATPLFAYLHAGGLWRPFLPHDRVLVTLEEGSWFPLAYEVRGGASGRVLFRAEARTMEPGPGSAWVPFLGTGRVRDLGFVEAPFASVAETMPTPATTAGLEPHRAGRLGEDSVVSYAGGLSWLVVRSPAPRAMDISAPGVAAERVTLPDGGIAYYEPATAMAGRRVFVRSTDAVVLESNLPRGTLFEVAASLPGRGAPISAAELGRVSLQEALASAPDALLPTDLPAEYRLTAATVAGSGVTFYFRRPGAELDGGGIRLYQAAGEPLPPPLEGEVVAVRVRGVEGRYSPARQELEWVEDGVYRALGGGALDLDGLLRVAESLGPA